ncbi:gamma-glutamylcyclotransferase family protein [Paracoccus sediminicola]|uniref:gamma-glutamylcyclotransferase family protein n=1 Tax=Paracoccus sediminicola TaxID=3017783 RepID=UPI0022F0F5E4|nr:gamma-glutamylcyclotransferase family protein [Paracoccus sediminicola]WBU55757.1 gamma-glutamylcyclotransferase [Paracoccus sediminicola]
MLYFAYGSNMLHARLAARCPSADAIGRAEAPGFGIAFDKIGQDGSGKATLRQDSTEAAQGVLYEITPAEIALLDKIEGVGRGYDRAEVAVRSQHAEIMAFSYIAAPAFRQQGLLPFAWYRGLVLAGALENDLPEAWVSKLAAQPYTEDPEPHRPRRIEAQHLLAALPAEWRLG